MRFSPLFAGRTKLSVRPRSTYPLGPRTIVSVDVDWLPSLGHSCSTLSGMDDFFDMPTQPPATSECTALPVWAGPPDAVLPGTVAVSIVLAHNDQAAVSIGRCDAYPTGFTFEVDVVASQVGLDPSMHGLEPRRRTGNTYATMLRLGVQFADGGRATNVRDQVAELREPPAAPYMRPTHGSGSQGRWRQEFWVWPLPPPGSLAFVCQWPAAGISLTQAEIEGSDVTSAADRAVTMAPRRPDVTGGSIFLTDRD